MLKIGDVLKYVGPSVGYKIPLMTVTAYDEDRPYGIAVRYHEPMVMPDGQVENDDMWRTVAFQNGDLVIHREISHNLKRHSF